MKRNFLYSAALIAASVLMSFNIYSQSAVTEKTGGLPEGVTQEWLNEIKDENGNKINPEESEDAFQTRNFTGYTSGDRYGYSVASAGDVNNDGYNDIIVGAPYFNGPAPSAGRAYIYYGGQNVNSVPDVTLICYDANSGFGSSVASAGDINGDGYSDVIVGASFYNNYTGKAYIYLGGASMNNTPDLAINGDTISDQLGCSVSSAGDINADGFSDVLIGVSGADSSKGKVYVLLGGVSLNNVPDIILYGENANDFFGCSVAGGGDLNNDGFTDVIAGASSFDSNKGRSYIFFGGTNMNSIPDAVLTGRNTNDVFGMSVAFAGDVNGDMLDDVIIGAPGYSTQTGAAYIYFGGTFMDSTADLIVYGENSSDYFGSSVSATGDINGDGYSEIMSGASSHNNFAGKVYIYYGGSSPDAVPDMTINGESSFSYLGISIASAGDMNGDGFSDILAGAIGVNLFTGKAYLYMQGMNGTYFPDLSFNGEATGSGFSISVASAGDVNGDSFSDIIVGARSYNSSTGRAYIYLGGINMDNTPDVIFNGESTGNNFGVTVSTAGDVNSDGYSDVIVGADFYSAKGRAYVFFGGIIMDSGPDVVMTGESSNNFFGHSVSAAGDVNSDGYSDVIVGAYGYVGSGSGRAYIYFGSSSMNNIADFTVTGESATSVFGYSVAGAGDVNGDGFSDVLIGSHGFSGNTGKAYIYFGAFNMSASPSVIMTGEASNDFFGREVSSAGDVNADGYSDWIVGADNASKAYLYFGGPSANNAADLILYGQSAGYGFGASVSSAGDLNRDGYSDIIIGEYRYNNLTGRAYVYFGGASMNAIDDVVLNGETANSNFGACVSLAGDVNGDGNTDMIVSASGYNSGTGRAYIYKSNSPSIKPNLVSVKDIPDDQGGAVRLKWVKSAYDVPVNGIITSYLIERSVPPGLSGFQWEQIGTVLPTQSNLYYYFTASTPADSGINSNSTFYFRITAYTGNSSHLFRSGAMSGKSIDNLAPQNVQNFSLTPISNNIRISWNRNHESDLKNYVLYRSSSSSVNTETEPVFSTLTDSTYLDTAPLSGMYYYFIAAQDIHNNKSPLVAASSPHINLNLTMFI